VNGTLVNIGSGLELWSRVIGQGEPVVVPNGDYFVADLEGLADEFALVTYDPRNRGRSQRLEADGRFVGDIHTDVADLEQLRKRLGIERLNLLGHSYAGVLVALYAMEYPQHVQRIVQIGPPAPRALTQYGAHEMWDDGVAGQVFAGIGQIMREAAGKDPVEVCRSASAVLARLCVVDAADAGRLNWGRCDLPNERTFMKYWIENLQPSLQKLAITPEMFARVACPVLVIHGRKDRNAPWGAGRDWAKQLPNARLLTIENAAHAPWIEAPEVVLGAIRDFLRSDQ
jgi:proline iminopeptidase